MDCVGIRASPGCFTHFGEPPVVIGSVGWRLGMGVPGDGASTSM